ncbi:alcohol dehydrogenase catalytic domain-containing protein [Nonomuraea sp. NPDC049028]|uniref:alcohol dehydrogenase catalytic domain-containing protein n=1 Tax=Nonomuraea sp. NPDC049028 TaxID=3364348 RepID=UPI00371491EA
MSLGVRFSEYGTPDVLRVVDVPPPTAGPGQVRLAVRAAGVNPIDWKILHGYMSQVMPLDLPGGLGSDVAGVVDQVGKGVTAFSVGDEVLRFLGVKLVTYGKGLVESLRVPGGFNAAVGLGLRTHVDDVAAEEGEIVVDRRPRALAPR